MTAKKKLRKTWYYELRCLLYDLWYGIPTLCAKHSVERKKRYGTTILSSQNCDECTKKLVQSRRLK